MKVELIDVAGGDLSIVNSARVSFNKEVEEVEERDEKLIQYLANHRHDTPFRHNFIQLRCSAPVFLARQLMKHQAGLTWNEVSRRYIDEPPEFYMPHVWRKRPDKSIKQGSGDKHEDSDDLKRAYNDIVNYSLENYEAMIGLGVAPEMARMILPQSMMVDWIWSGNLLAFHHVYALRSGEGAQKEAQEFAKLLKDAIVNEFPIGWKALEERLL